MEPSPVKRRRSALIVVLALIGVPVALVLSEATAFHVVHRNNGTMVSSGERREYLLYVPHSYDPARPAPLVISMHGAGLWPAAQMAMSQWNAAAERHGVIVAYPSGKDGRGPRIWRADGGAGLEKDVRFISELIDKLRADYSIDPARIYANGLSNGGGMAFVLSCTLSDRIAAVGMVGAAHLLAWSWCTDQRPVPVIAFHGTADLAAPYDGGKSWVAPRPFPDVPGWMDTWARRNRCAANPVESVMAADVTRIQYTDCAADAVLYRIEGGGHTWPGGRLLPEWALGRTTYGIDATSEMWAFFRDHPLPRRVDE
jgi:polyhydroxybutyrate depolymerase